MNRKHVLLLTLISILILLTITQNQRYQTGTIQNIQISKTITKITLENQSEKLVIFSNKPMNLNKKDKIKFIGNIQTYNNENEIIVNKIIKLK